MRRYLLAALFAGVAAAVATPLGFDKRNNTSSDYGLKFLGDSSLPKVVIYDTGGTIRSGSNYSRLDNINYGSGYSPTTVDLLGNYSEILNVAQIAIVTYPAAKGSADLNSTLFYNISRDANEHLCSVGSDILGGVMLHGTNTLEDTIFGLDLTVNCSKPVIATGAMRPETYISHDGPSNLYQAVATAVDPMAKDRGALIVFNDRITSAYWALKTDGNTPDTFKALEQGNLGSCLGGQPFWFYRPSYPYGRKVYDISSVGSGSDLPSVIVLFGQQGFDAGLMYAAVAHGAKGIVIQGSGAGALSSDAIAAAAVLKKQGIPVVASLRPVTGASVPTPYEASYIKSGYLQAGKSRIQLQLCLAVGKDWEGCRADFEDDMRAAIYNYRTTYYY